MNGFTTWDIVRNLLLATRWTVVLSLVAFLGGGIGGLLILFARVSGKPWLRVPTKLYIELFQGTPLLMQLFLIFFGLSLFGIDVPAWLAAALALTLWTAAYLGEIWRGCVEAVGRGQWQAAASLGMTYVEQMRWVILPQALRIAIPPTVGFLVQVVKATATTSIIGFIELTKSGTIIANATYSPFAVYGIVALIYLSVCWPLSQASRRLEVRLNVGHRSH